MNRIPPAFSAMVLALAGGCAAGTHDPEAEAPVARQPAATCNAARLGQFTGQQASAETGAHILATSGAKALRWVPPRTAVTMDFRQDRVTVSYDDAMTITHVNCG